MLDSNSCVSWFTYLWIVSATVCIILLNFLKSLAVSDSKVIQNVVLIKASVLTGQSPLFGARIPLRIGRGHISVKIISPYILFTTCLNYNTPVYSNRLTLCKDFINDQDRKCWMKWCLIHEILGCVYTPI